MAPVLSLLLALTVARADSVDVLIKGGTVYDGSGKPARVADVGLRGERIVFVGDAAKAQVYGRKVIDARGLIVAPGFIDPHTHSMEGVDRFDDARRRNIPALMQGVTTVTNGPDGRGPWDVARIQTETEQKGLGTNTFATVGFGTVRAKVMGNSSAPAAPAQIDSMRALITKAMREGAYGVGGGLFYAPQSYASTEEVIAVVSAAKPYGGVYDSHPRDESSYTIGLMNSTPYSAGRSAPTQTRAVLRQMVVAALGS
ncbi:MAG: amidohydrolase family protein [Gemmatimonadaceae bacterium]|nr:amidohydrolase family protein [Gemmatimonadaceae bacterium]